MALYTDSKMRSFIFSVVPLFGLCITDAFLHSYPTIRKLANSDEVSRLPDSSLHLKTRLFATPGIGDDGCMLPSPSGVNQLPQLQQFAIVIGIFVALVAGTVPFVALLDLGRANIPLFKAWMSSYPILGAIYAAAGIAHFTVKDEFCNIMPAKGSWGVWYLAGSKFFHVAWTGIAEFVLGASLFLSYITSFFGYASTTITQNSALGLLILTSMVTPANIYMFTHGARLPMNAPPVSEYFFTYYISILLSSFRFYLKVPNQFHIVRGIMQIVLFGILYEIYVGHI